jgi:hypothetical protein
MKQIRTFRVGYINVGSETPTDLMAAQERFREAGQNKLQVLETGLGVESQLADIIAHYQGAKGVGRGDPAHDFFKKRLCAREV